MNVFFIIVYCNEFRLNQMSYMYLINRCYDLIQSKNSYIYLQADRLEFFDYDML